MTLWSGNMEIKTVILKLDPNELWHFWQILMYAKCDQLGMIDQKLVDKIREQTYISTGSEDFKDGFYYRKWDRE